jgi:ferredoxin
VSEKFQVTVDTARCQAYGVCVATDPDVFDVPPDSTTAVVLREVVDAGELEDVEEAVRGCPAQAIALKPVTEQ